mmetsp:Transcript_51872/g.103227  ORF Transcript_51872/g.103227 Transcript_51872/m.103227 type:complete len:279 (+) Transcript_51872:657-1493(+)
MHVRVEIRLDVPVRRAALHGQEPLLDPWPLRVAPQSEPLVVGARGRHPLEKGSEHAVDQRELTSEEVGPSSDTKLAVDAAQQIFKVEALRTIGHGRGEPAEPRREELALEREERAHARGLLGVRLGVGKEGAIGEGALDGHDDVIGLTDHLTVHLCNRDAARRLHRPEPRGLFAVAVHVDLLHRIWHALLLEREPDLFAVRAPGGGVSVEGNAWLLSVGKREEPLARESTRALGASRFEVSAEAALLLGGGVLPRRRERVPGRRCVLDEGGGASAAQL